MTNFKEIPAKELSQNAFQTIGSDWLLVTAKKDNSYNSMTASWGGFGIMWGKEVAYIVLRPQRYTKEFIDNTTHFSLSVLPESYRDVYKYLGSVSGRNEDKMANIPLTVVEENNVPFFSESNTVFICKKLYAQEMKKELMLNDWVDEKWYPEQDYHTMYIAEIEKVLIHE